MLVQDSRSSLSKPASSWPSFSISTVHFTVPPGDKNSHQPRSLESLSYVEKLRLFPENRMTRRKLQKAASLVTLLLLHFISSHKNALRRRKPTNYFQLQIPFCWVFLSRLFLQPGLSFWLEQPLAVIHRCLRYLWETDDGRRVLWQFIVILVTEPPCWRRRLSISVSFNGARIL